MARKGALKVFRTPIGFHDAYVAATSRKAALEAWGAAKDLFASDSAELVTDPKLTAAPLAAPGEVIKLPRGTLDEHLRAARPSAPKRARSAPPKGEPAPQKQPKPKPRPSRTGLDRAEAEVEAFEAQAAGERAELDRREAELLAQRKALNAELRREGDRLDARLERARETYEAAMERWRTE